MTVQRLQSTQSTQSNGVLDRDGKSQKEYGRVVGKCDFGGMAEVAKDDDVGLVEVKKAGRKSLKGRRLGYARARLEVSAGGQRKKMFVSRMMGRCSGREGKG